MIDQSTIRPTGDGRYIHEQRFIIDEGPTIAHVNRLALANRVRQKGFSDGRLMKFRARIPEIRVWEAEHVLGYNLNDPADLRAYLVLHPEYIISPEDTGHSGKIIVKGD